jgi:hypothetical protein
MTNTAYVPRAVTAPDLRNIAPAADGVRSFVEHVYNVDENSIHSSIIALAEGVRTAREIEIERQLQSSIRAAVQERGAFIERAIITGPEDLIAREQDCRQMSANAIMMNTYEQEALNPNRFLTLSQQSELIAENLETHIAPHRQAYIDHFYKTLNEPVQIIDFCECTLRFSYNISKESFMLIAKGHIPVSATGEIQHFAQGIYISQKELAAKPQEFVLSKITTLSTMIRNAILRAALQNLTGHSMRYAGEMDLSDMVQVNQGRSRGRRG